MKSLAINGNSLTIDQVNLVAFNPEIKIELDFRAKEKVIKCNDYLKQLLKSKEIVYGINTGFGELSHIQISESDIQKLQENLIKSHCCGMGEGYEKPIVRAIILLRANVLAAGFSGVRPIVIETLLDLLNKDVFPFIPQKGSVGASGDLAPLAHLAAVLIGRGEVWEMGNKINGLLGLKKHNISPLVLEAKEGLALINGTQVMTAVGALTYVKAKELSKLADLAGAMSLEVFKGTFKAFDEDVQELRPYLGQEETARNLRVLSEDSEIYKSHENCGKVQDPYSFRCMPQVHGATREALRFVESILTKEINAVTDNPIMFYEKEKIISCGNFHGQMVSLSMDVLSIAMTTLSSISERRIDKLVDSKMSGQTPFLIKNPGLNSGLMMAQVTAASLVSENKCYSHPASVDSIPTSADKEDHVSMGTIAANKAMMITENTKRVLAIELLCDVQGLELSFPHKPSLIIQNVFNKIRETIPYISEDREYSKDLNEMVRLIDKGEIQCLIERVMI